MSRLQAKAQAENVIFLPTASSAPYPIKFQERTPTDDDHGRRIGWWLDALHSIDVSDINVDNRLATILEDWYAKQEWHEHCTKALTELLETSGNPDWDGEGADPITNDVIETAIEALQYLPTEIEPPDISADPHGNIEFDWHLKNGTMFTISIGKEGHLILSGLSKCQKDRLTCVEDDSRDPLPDLLHYGADWLRKMQSR